MAYVTEGNLTDVALERWKDIADPRLRQIMGSLIKHLHGFVRNIEPTQAEWAAWRQRVEEARTIGRGLSSRYSGQEI